MPTEPLKRKTVEMLAEQSPEQYKRLLSGIQPSTPQEGRKEFFDIMAEVQKAKVASKKATKEVSAPQKKVVE